MSASSSREAVLDRIRAATRNSAATAGQAAGEYAALARDYVRRGAMSADARLERMAERLREYDAEVVECAPEGLADAIRAQLAASGRRRFVAPEELPKEWLAEGFEWIVDRGLTAGEIEQAEGVVTACFCGIAESGTIVLHHSATEGRRGLTLLPDWHLCVLRASQIVETLPEYFDRCAIRDQGSGVRGQGVGNLPALHSNDKNHSQPPQEAQIASSEPRLPGVPRLVTWISGPSATADIEMTRIKGVHGPRFLNVILVRDGGSEP
jgi:L-lactate dehydrogenase complex protein LldG